MERQWGLDTDTVRPAGGSLDRSATSFLHRMTGCPYTWTNANDPDDLFYWHLSEIPVSSRLRWHSAGVLLLENIPG